MTAAAETLRIATYNTELSRRGPGLLYGAILKGDAQVLAVQGIIAEVRPDILLLTGFDYDAGLVALQAFALGLADRGQVYPHLLALRPNTGMATGLDMDGDGRLGGPGDAQGWGRFAGADGMAVLSRFPILTDEVRDFSAMLWRDLPGVTLPAFGVSDRVLAVQRLSTTGHWDVPVKSPGGVIHLLAFYATPPVFDGPEDRNGWRNQAEVGFWAGYLAGKLPVAAADAAFVILGDANLDPADGAGRRGAMAALLAHPLVQDPQPRSAGGVAAATAGQGGDPGLDTADWPDPDDPVKPGPGNLRVDYVLPSVHFTVTGSGVFWPAPDAAGVALLGEGEAAASRHRLVWVDVVLR